MYETLLVPIEGAPDGEPAVLHAMDLASSHEAAVEILHVINPARYTGIPLEAAWDGIAQSLSEDAERAVEQAASLAPPEVPVETLVVEGQPGARIVEEAERPAVDLVVMGTHGRAGVDRLLLGSVAERVVRESPVPVLTVPLD